MNEHVYLTLGSCWKGEADVAKDFVLYHQYVGVERFIIYSREPDETSAMFADDPTVIVKAFQENAFNIHSNAWAGLIRDCQVEFPTTWLALIDADQVLCPVKTDDIREVLKDYEQYASLQLSWHTFGSNGHETKTEGSLYERFTKRAKADAGINRHTQTICQPTRTLALKTDDPHHVKLPYPEISVNTNKEPIVPPSPFTRQLHDVAYIPHYISKSKEEWAIKNGKLRCDIWQEAMPFTMFDEHEAFCNEEEETRVLELWNRAKDRATHSSTHTDNSTTS
jgi:hypothetical protein